MIVSAYRCTEISVLETQFMPVIVTNFSDKKLRVNISIKKLFAFPHLCTTQSKARDLSPCDQLQALTSASDQYSCCSEAFTWRKADREQKRIHLPPARSFAPHGWLRRRWRVKARLCSAAQENQSTATPSKDFALVQRRNCPVCVCVLAYLCAHCLSFSKFPHVVMPWDCGRKTDSSDGGWRKGKGKQGTCLGVLGKTLGVALSRGLEGDTGEGS